MRSLTEPLKLLKCSENQGSYTIEVENFEGGISIVEIPGNIYAAITDFPANSVIALVVEDSGEVYRVVTDDSQFGCWADWHDSLYL